MVFSTINSLMYNLNISDLSFRRASYLAKTNTKGNTPQGQRELFSSRIVSDNKYMS